MATSLRRTIHDDSALRPGCQLGALPKRHGLSLRFQQSHVDIFLPSSPCRLHPSHRHLADQLYESEFGQDIDDCLWDKYS